MSKLFEYCQNVGERVAHAVVVRSAYHRKILVDKGLCSVLHLPDGVDPQIFSPRDSSRLRKRLQLEQVITVGMSGSMRASYLYGHDVVEVVARLQDLPVKGVNIGGWGEGLAAVEAKARHLGLSDRILFTGPIYDEEERCAHLCLIDICLLTRLDEEWSRAGKLPEYLACARYVVASHVGEVGRLVAENEVGKTFPISADIGAYYDQVADHVRAMIETPDAFVPARERGRQLALQTFSYDVLTDRLAEFLELGS